MDGNGDQSGGKVAKVAKMVARRWLRQQVRILTFFKNHKWATKAKECPTSSIPFLQLL